MIQGIFYARFFPQEGEVSEIHDRNSIMQGG
jgi:hypothetical protein